MNRKPFNILSGKAAVLTLLAAVLTACEYKELDDYTANPTCQLQVEFDWSKVDSIPTWMRLGFYPYSEDGVTRGYELYDISSEGDIVNIYPGVYNITTWNSDANHVYTSGYSSRENINATTGKYSTHGNYLMPPVLDSIFEGQRVLDYPDYMVHANMLTVEVQPVRNQKVTLTPDSMVVTVDMQLNGIKGLEYCKSIRGALNNVAGRRYMAFDNKTEETVAIMFDAGVKDDSTVVARFWVFGIEPTGADSLQHQVVMFFWMQSGQVFVPIDITNTLSDVDKDDKYIFINSPDLGIDLRDYLPQGGWQIDVDGWENVNTPISL